MTMATTTKTQNGKKNFFSNEERGGYVEASW